MDRQVCLSNYDYVFLSCEIGLQKPDKEIYEYIMKETDFAPQDILFIDDQQKNIDSASALGWNTFLGSGEDLESIKNAVEEFLNKN